MKPVLQSPAPTATAAHTPGARALQQEKPPQWAARAPQLESNPCKPELETTTRDNKDPAQPKIKK